MMSVFVRPSTGDQTPVHVEVSDDATVGHLIFPYTQYIGCSPLNGYRISFEGKPRDRGSLLADEGIGAEAIVQT